MGREQHNGGRTRGDGGSALVESAIVLPFLVLMVFGIVEVGFLFRSAAVTNNASRSGARLAAAQYGSAKSSQQRTVMDNVALTVEKDLQSRGSDDTPTKLWIYQADTNGYPVGKSDFSACTSPCFVYTWNTTSGHFDYSSGSWALPTVCGSTHDSVGVYVTVDHAPVGFTNFLGTIALNEKTVMRLEPPNPNTCPQGS